MPQHFVKLCLDLQESTLANQWLSNTTAAGDGHDIIQQHAKARC